LTEEERNIEGKFTRSHEEHEVLGDTK